MKPVDVRKQHAEAWDRLFALVKKRNHLLDDLGTSAKYAGDFSPATGMFMEFDFERAQQILAKVQEMTPAIYAAIDELNGYAEQIGKPRIERKKWTPP